MQFCNQMRIMKKLFLLTVLFILSHSITNYAQITYSIKDFDRIYIQGNIEADIERNEVESVVIERNGHDAHEKISVETEGKTLKIKMSLKDQVKGDKLKITIYLKHLKEMKVSAGALARLNYPIEGQDFTAYAHKGASLYFEGDFNNLELEASTGAKINVKGTTSYLKAHAMTTGEIKAEQLIAEKALLKAHTAACLHTQVRQDVEAKVSTGAEIILEGNPLEEKISTSAGGKLTRIRRGK